MHSKCKVTGATILKKNKHISIRINKNVLEKFHYVADYADRSASGQIMFLINNCIREFEEKYGVIDLDEKDDK